LIKPVDFELLETTLARWVEGADLSDQTSHNLNDEFGVLDLQRIAMLGELGPDHRSFFEQFVETFVARMPYDVEAIRSAVLESAHERVAESAHLLKGSSQNLGAVEVGRACQALEDAGLKQDLTDGDELLGALEEQAACAVAALHACAVQVAGSRSPRR
jgi:HPt (histidine-containing phosphotransfer) domain-containing protein